MIVNAELQKQPASFPAAKKVLDQWKSIPGMSQRELANMSLAEARLCFMTGDLDRCEKQLLSIDATLPEHYEAMLWRGRWRLEAAGRPGFPVATKEKLSKEAADILRSVIVAADTSNAMRRQATYLSGLNQRNQGKLKEALGTFSGVRQRSPHSAEAIASGIEEAEILFNSQNLSGAVNTVHHILRNIEDIELYNGYWLPLNKLKSRLLDIGRKLSLQGEYDRSIELANYLSLAFPRSDALRLQAETYEQWGTDLAASPLPAKVDAKVERRVELNDKYIKAAETYEQLAALELRSSDYPEIVWQAAESFRKANNLERANRLLAEYLRYEERNKHGRALVALGRNYIHAGEWQKAVEPLERCLTEYATNPVSYEARLLAANAKLELGELEEAIELLESNLSDYQLDPKSPIWQDSLFELGQTIFERGDELLLTANADQPPGADQNVQDRLEKSHDKFMLAVQRLGEAASRYGEDPRNFATRHLLARSYRLAAKTPETIVKSQPDLVDSARRGLLQQRREMLEKALEEFRNLHTAINQRSESYGTSEELMSLTRNCYFGEADALYDLARWEEAIVAYRNVASRYLNQPEALEALVQLAQCHRKLGREFEAKKTLTQAEQVLRRIPADQDERFVAYTRASRPEWEQLIGWLRKWN